MLAIVLAGCSDIDNVLDPQTDGGETLPFSTVIPAGSAAPTRGLEISTDDKSIKAEWVKGEKIALVHGETIDEMTVSAVDTDGNATITGEVNNYKADETAYLVYAGTRRTDPTADAILTDYISILEPAYADAKTADASLKAITKEIILKTFDISEQSGTINDINETSDYRLGESKLTKKGAYATLTTSPVLQSQFAVWKLSLRDTTSALSTQALDVYDADGKPVVKGVVSSTSVSDFYYLLPAASNATYTFVAAAADGNIYSNTTKNITLEAGKYYRSTLTLKEDLRATPLTFEANAANATVTFGIADVATNSVSYRQYDSSAKAWTDWTAYTDNTPVELTNIGDKVQFKAENATYATTSSCSNIQCSADCYAYGNIMSLTDGDSFSTADELTGTYTFRELFNGSSILLDPSKPLLLPATKLTDFCYISMFNNCDQLTDVLPALPATELKEGCYYSMFANCNLLATVPEGYLPATQLAPFCYSYMFSSCVNLTTVPADLLPAETLAESCYNNMFYGCTSLTTVPTDLLPAETLAKFCYSFMFSGCSKLTAAPVLTAKTLVEGCYNQMFYNCAKLGSVTCLATDIAATNCLFQWLMGAGTADGCERKVYVDPSMMSIEYGDVDGQWNFGLSGNGSTKTWSLAAVPHALAKVVDTDLGSLVGADGNIYTNASQIAAAGTTAEAVIAYVGSVPNYFDKFLAIALTDVDNQHNWVDALTEVGTYAANHPITIGATTYNTCTTGATCYDRVADYLAITSATAKAKQTGWRLPSVTDWRYVFDGLGRIKAGLTLTAMHSSGSPVYSSNATPTDPLGVEGQMIYRKGDDASQLRAAINEACGNTFLLSDIYWSSSEKSVSDSEDSWNYSFHYGIFLCSKKTINNKCVRAVFAY